MKTMTLVATAIILWAAPLFAQEPPPAQTPAPSDTARPADTAPQAKTDVTTATGQALMVKNMAFCKNVEQRQPVDKALDFESSIGRIYFWSEVTNTGEPTSVTHIWYQDGAERARVELPAKYPRNRIWSSKDLGENAVGTWRVETISAGGDKLAQDSCAVR